MTDAKEVVERLARAINPLAFEEVGAPQNKGPVMQKYYAVICNKAREQARAALTELSAMGLVVVPRKELAAVLAFVPRSEAADRAADELANAMTKAQP